MRHLDEIVVHCTATRPDWYGSRTTAEKVAEVRRWHTDERGWSDIGYHFLIDRDGTTMEGRPLSRQGAHVRGNNATTIGVALFGGHGGATDDRFEDHFTARQDAALRTLLNSLRTQYPEITKITGHNEYANKACPCFDVTEWLAEAPVAAIPEPAPTGLAAFIARIFGGGSK